MLKLWATQNGTGDPLCNKCSEQADGVPHIHWVMSNLLAVRDMNLTFK